jgi:ribose/xylose/arabinose/galactoside ABC-type transport system permease subunit
MMAGLAAMVHVSIMRQIDPVTFNGYELKVIAAVVLGGVSITGGSGSVLGTVFGVLLLSVISNGLVLSHISTYWQQIIEGAILIFTVSVDRISATLKQAKIARVDIK